VFDCSCSAVPEIGVAVLLLPLMAQITEDATAMDGTYRGVHANFQLSSIQSQLAAARVEYHRSVQCAQLAS
jgi:hypothetical protein